MKTTNEELLARIEKIEQILITLYPQFECNFCEHEWEMRDFIQDFEGRTTSELIECPPYLQCKKCGLIKKTIIK